MKLPQQYDLYQHNRYCDELYGIALELNHPLWSTDIKGVCMENLLLLKKLSAIITHLELAIDEVLKVPGVSDE